MKFLIIPAVLVFCAAGAALPAQSLADIAAKEEKRREELREKYGRAESFDNKDLENIQGGNITAIGGKRPSPNIPSGMTEDARARSEESAKKRIIAGRMMIADLEKKIASLEAKSALVNNPYKRMLPEFAEMSRREAIETVMNQLKDARNRLDAAKERLEKMKSEMRKAGIPPGIIREGETAPLDGKMENN